MAFYVRSMHASSSTKKASISLVGASGKMGQALHELIDGDPEVEYLESGGDVLIDFSSPEGTRAAIAQNKPLVCGTTGLSKEVILELEELSKRVPVLYSPNFSIGMNLLFEFLEMMGEKLKKFSTIEIEETHHTEKKDSPSGTALKLAELIRVDPTEISAKRVGDVFGIHQLQFLFDDETLSISHEAHSRKAFAQGALVAAKFILKKPARIYSFREIFD